jgi:hypothetical protein
LATRTARAINADRDLEITIQFTLLGLTLTLVLLHVVGPAAFVRAALTG